MTGGAFILGHVGKCLPVLGLFALIIAGERGKMREDVQSVSYT